MKINEEKIIKYIRGLIYRVLILVVVFFIVAIIVKKDSNYKNIIYKNLYEDSISFAKINKLYNKYLGKIYPIVDNDIESVFNEEFNYYSDSNYYDGGVLEVDNNYLVPSLVEGMVIFIGEKENYGNVVIINTEDDKNIWYGNMANISVELYDYIEKGDYIGTTVDNKLYIVVSSNNTYLDYKEYIE